MCSSKKPTIYVRQMNEKQKFTEKYAVPFMNNNEANTRTKDKMEIKS